MYIVISGGGKVGHQLGRILHGKGHDVAIIEKKPEILEKLSDELSTGILLIEGDGCDLRIQEDAGTRKADLFVAVTGSDQDNLIACQLAKVRFGVERALARINSQKNERTFNELGIEGVSSTTVICNLIEKEMNPSELFAVHVLARGRLALVEITLGGGPAQIAGKRLLELELPGNTVLISIIRGDAVIIPRGDTELEAGDRVVAVTPMDNEGALRRFLAGG